MTNTDWAAVNEGLANLSRAMGVSMSQAAQAVEAFNNDLNKHLFVISGAFIEYLRQNHPNAFDESGNLHDDWLHRINHQQSAIDH